MQSVDIPRLVQLFDKSRIDEILRVGGLGSGEMLAGFFEDRFEIFEVRIGFWLDETTQQLIRILQVALVFDLHVFADGAFGGGGVVAHEMDTVDHRFHYPPDDVEIFHDGFLPV